MCVCVCVYLVADAEGVEAAEAHQQPRDQRQEGHDLCQAGRPPLPTGTSHWGAAASGGGGGRGLVHE